MDFNYLYLVAGILLSLLTAHEMIFTTFAPRGSGYITGSITTLIWGLLKWICRVFGNRSILTGAGVIIIVTVLMAWVVMLWAGNYLIFMADPAAVVDSTTNLPADYKEKIYYTGYTLSTLGNGDFKAGTDAWRIYAAFISFTGLILITIAISYMVPVLSAVTARRSLSIRIASIGDSPQAMLLNNWNGHNFDNLEGHLDGLAESITMQGQQHLAYPVLHYFHTTNKTIALLPNIAALDEALSLMLLYIPEEHRINQHVLVATRMAISTFLDSLTSIFINPEKADVPALDLAKLKASGIPLKSTDAKTIEKLNHRRQTLKAMVDNDGWKWSEISDPVFNDKMDLNLYAIE